MALDLSTTALLASIRRRASIPSSSTTGTADADLLRYVNEELQLRLVADIMRVKEEYFVQTQNYTISSATQRYRIPSRAIGNKTRAVYLVDSNGSYYPLPRIDPEHRHEYNGSSDVCGYLVEGNDIVLVPGSNTSATTLRVKFYIRPAEVFAVGASTATVLSFVTSTGVITTAATHSFTTSTPIDIVSSSPGNEPIAFSLTPTATTSTTITIATASLPQTLAVSDKIFGADACTVPQIPGEYHTVLAQRVAVKVLESLGKLEEAAAASQELASMEQQALALISPRTDAQPRKIFTSRGVLGSSCGGRRPLGSD